ncbi:MAG: aa3-type cytochrome c oxidase subunit IV [Devosiaceae bacterium]
MAEASKTTTPVSNDYVEHNRTFDVFITLLKYGTAATIVVLILMAIFLL